jgi:hypothetical protein
MKQFYLVITAMIIAIAGNAQLFNQNFQSSTSLGAYSSVTPTNAQFNEIYDGDAGSNMVVSINSVAGANTLRYVRSGAGATGGYTRSTDFTTQPGVMAFSFTINVSGNLPNNTDQVAAWYFGNGYINGGTAPSVNGGGNLTYSYFFLDMDDNGGTDRARFSSPGGTQTNWFNVNTSQNIYYIVNNSGATVTYSAPDGSSETLGNDQWDLWIGNSLEIDDLNATGPTETITDMKFLYNGGAGTIDLDNMDVSEVVDFPSAFYQDFSSSTTFGDYDSNNPNNGQVNQIFDGGTGMAISINTTGGNKLRFTKSGDGAGGGGFQNVGSFTRTTNLSGAPNTLMFEFDFNASPTNDKNRAAKFYIGEGIPNDQDIPANGDIHSYFEIDFNDAATDQFRLRKGGNGGSTAADISSWFNLSATPYRILFVVNNSGASLNYYTPSGVEEAIANDTYVLWIGATKAFTSNGTATTAGNALEDFKFLWNDGTGTIDFDNMLMNPIPVVNTTVAPDIISNTVNPRFNAKWTASTPTSRITGYRLDVATNIGFTTFVPGFQNLYVDGINTLQQLVTGVSTLNTHYIRVRPVYQIGSNEVSGEFSNATTLSSAIFLPVTLTSFTGSVVNKAGELKWVSESEVNNSHYEIERSNDGTNFVSVGNVNSKNSATGASYAFRDGSIAEGKNYYRLKMVDIDGKFEYSHVIMLTYAGGLRTMSAYPNPTVGNVTVQFSKAGNGASVKVISMEGRVMQQVSVPANATQLGLNMANYVPGIYTIVYNNNGEQFTQRIQKQ